jgi:glycosyltransferase involved in cell wall biosynthesis
LKISGFTFVRNAVKLQYPIVESIRSILPIVDEFVIAVGQGDDDTAGLIRSIGSPKIRIIDSQWNPNVRSGGYVLAQQTNVALLNCTGEWAIYLQADEAIHERDHARLVELMTQYREDDRIEGMLMQRISFFGDYDTVLDVHPFKNDLACRLVKPHRFVLSRGDAAGFTVHPKYKEHGHRIRVVDTGLDVFHYCDVRPPSVSAQFQDEKNKFWTDEAKPADYYQKIPRGFLARFRGSHPAPMRERIAAYDQPLDLASPRWRTTLTPKERRQQLRTRLIDVFGHVAASGRTSRKIVASHRAAKQHSDIGE